MLLKTLLLFSFGLSLPLRAADCEVVRAIPIRLINDAAINPRVMVAARQEAAYVLKSLCVQVEWTTNSSPALEMRMIVGPLSAGITDRALGLTIFPPDHRNRGAVFLSRVSAMEQTYGYLIDLGRLLGCVLAHEIGHMLLNTNAHSPEGIMIAHFGNAEIQKAVQRQLLFTRSNREMFSAR